MPRIYFDAKEQGCSSYSGPTVVLKLLMKIKGLSEVEGLQLGWSKWVL